jgi:hypothetical protein
MIEDIKNTSEEELKTYFWDSFLSTDTMIFIYTGQGFAVGEITNLELHTGIVSPGSALMKYNRQAFNPHYSEVIFKMRFNSEENLLAFFGYEDGMGAISEDMTHSHVGIVVKDGKVYFSSADGGNQQRTEIVGLDLTKNYEFKIIKTELWVKELPQVVSYLGLPKVEYAAREWRKVAENDTYTADDKEHFLKIFIENSTNADKYITCNRIIYKEVYPD